MFSIRRKNSEAYDGVFYRKLSLVRRTNYRVILRICIVTVAIYNIVLLCIYYLPHLVIILVLRVVFNYNYL